MKKFILTVLLLGLGACGGGKQPAHNGIMSAAECQTADWRSVGYEDANRGLKTDNLRNYRRACAEFGISPDLEGYLAGHAQGLAVYCQPQNGFRLGTQGQQYNGGCPFAMEGAFRAAFAEGAGLYDRQMAVDQSRSQLDYARQRSKEIEFQIVDRTAAAASPLMFPADRIAIGLEIKNLIQEKAALNASIPQLEQDHEAAQADYDAYRASLTGRYAES